jgi:hypothetical protein
VVFENYGHPHVHSTTNANSADNCTCAPSFYPNALGECVACPYGAHCSGHELLPVAVDGYGQVRVTDDGEHVFAECGKKFGCRAGFYRGDVHWPHDCAAGYVNGNTSDSWNTTRLCSLCDYDSGYFMVSTGCIQCDYGAGNAWYLILTAVTVLFWFPLLRELVGARFKSLYVTIS